LASAISPGEYFRALQRRAAFFRRSPRDEAHPRISCCFVLSFVLDAVRESDCIARMKTKFFAAFIGALVLVTGCVGTVSGRKTVAVPFVNDRLEGRYERPVEKVFDAAKQVVRDNGVLISESNLLNETNTVKTLEGKVNQRDVWVRVESLDPKVTGVVVQVRTKGGAADLPLAHELEKQISLKLTR
jgi:hypothetical protein